MSFLLKQALSIVKEKFVLFFFVYIQVLLVFWLVLSFISDIGASKNITLEGGLRSFISIIASLFASSYCSASILYCTMIKKDSYSFAGQMRFVELNLYQFFLVRILFVIRVLFALFMLAIIVVVPLLFLSVPGFLSNFFSYFFILVSITLFTSIVVLADVEVVSFNATAKQAIAKVVEFFIKCPKSAATFCAIIALPNIMTLLMSALSTHNTHGALSTFNISEHFFSTLFITVYGSVFYLNHRH